MVKFLGKPLQIPAATTDFEAVQRSYVDAVKNRVATLEANQSSPSGMVLKRVSANYTASASDYVLVDATSAPITITLPSTPAASATVGVKKNDSGTNTVTVVAPGGTTVDSGADLVIDLPYVGATLVYDAVAHNWVITAVVLFDAAGNALTYRGPYSSSTAYAANDIVYFAGNAYVSRVGSTGVDPTVDVSSASWGLLALHGAKGDPGTAGAAGSAATVSVGSTTTGAAGSNASVTNSGSSSAAVLNFTIPQGAKGDPGTQGNPGSPGSAATVTVGSTTTGAAGTNASVTNSGTSSAAVLNFTIPQGAKGDPGTAGSAGTAATVAVGTTTTGAAGSNASVTNSGTSSAAVLDFTIPRGAQGVAGTAATITVGTVTTGAAGSSVAVTNSGTSSAAVFNFTIPRGDTGASGSGSTTTIVSKTAAYTAAVNDFVLANASSGTFTVTLPATPATGSTVTVKKVDSSINVVTVAPGAGATIDGDTSCVLTVYEAAASFMYDGTNWQIRSTALLNTQLAASLVNRGTYSSSATYSTNDVVQYSGSSYIAVQTSTNVTPPNATYWAVFAAAGTSGTSRIQVYRSGANYHAPGTINNAPFSASANLFTFTANVCYWLPVSTPIAVACNFLGLLSAGNSTGATVTFRMALYNLDNAQLQAPGALLKDIGTFTVANGAAASILGAAAASFTIATGNYWVAIVADGAATGMSTDGWTQQPRFHPANALAQFTAPVTMYTLNGSGAYITGGFPATAPAISTFGNFTSQYVPTPVWYAS